MCAGNLCWICNLGIAVTVQDKHQTINVSMKVSAYKQVSY